jgi:hypothetical protein
MGRKWGAAVVPGEATRCARLKARYQQAPAEFEADRYLYEGDHE